MNVDPICRSPLLWPRFVMVISHSFQPTLLDLDMFEMWKEFGRNEARSYLFLKIDGRILIQFTGKDGRAGKEAVSFS